MTDEIGIYRIRSVPIPPFDELSPPRDEHAWMGGARRRPTWRRSAYGIDRAGFHALIRAARLPLAELLHMGAVLEPGGILDRKGSWVDETDALLLLGRVAWDAVHGDAGEVWRGVKAQRRQADRLATKLVEEYFPR